MLSKSFKSGKCKTSLKLAISRIKLLKNRREIQVKQLRRELAQLLETGQEQTARIRVEHVIREEKTMSAYDLIEIYCELIVARMPIIESQKSCPIDLKEAISSVIFASPRCADIPELIDARKQFVAKYGKEFVTSALELRPDCGVNRMIVEKLSAKTPGTETKMKILTAIAKEHEIKWDSKPLEEELQKPEDQLNGSSGFIGANKMPVEPLNINFSPNTSQPESASIVYHTDVPSKPTSVDSSSQANLRTTPLVPPLIPNESRESDGKAGGVWEIEDSYPREEAASFEQPTWRMEFKDAASAAKVAAESAERASIAARAAAELASRGNISRQNTYEPNGSSLHSGDERPKRAVSSKLKGKINESANMEYDQGKVFQGMKEEVHKLPRDELREEISHHSSTSDEGMEYSSQMYNVRKFDSFRGSFSRMEMGNLKKHDEAGFVEKNVEVNYDRLASAGSMGTFDDETIWVPPIDEHQTGNHDIMGHNIHEIDAGERLFSYDSKEHVFIDYPAAVFDEYDPEPANDKENLFDSFKKKRNDQSPIFAPSTSSINSNIFSNSHHESHPVSVEKIPSSKFDDSMSAAFDDSDGLASESDDDMSSFQQNGTTQNSSLQHEESDLGGDLHPREKLQPSSSTKAKSLLGAEEKSHLQVPTPVGAKDPEMPEELASGGNFGLNFERLTGGLRNRGYSHSPYTGSSVVDSPVSSLETLGSTSGTNQINFPLDKPFGSSLIEDDSLNPIMPGASTNLESEKAKGSLSDEYNQGSRSNETFSTDRSEEDATGFSVKQSVSNQEKSRRYRGGDPNPSKQVPYDSTNNPSEFPTVSEVINQKLYDEKPRTKAYKELSSRMSKADFDSDGEVEERDSQVNVENHGNASSNTTFKLSRRTKDFTLKGGANLPRSTGYSDISNSKTESRATRRSFAPELPSQTVDKAAIVQGKQNRKSAKPNSSAESMPEFSVHEENKKTTEGNPDPATTSINSGNSKPSDFGGGKKLQETASQKVSHVHPKLPDYETFAAHFQSLRSNRRQL